nr:hypothetical protein [uncultured Hyphomonas sp.]
MSKLTIRYEPYSYSIAQFTKFVVRDGRLNLVETLTGVGPHELELRDGLYQIEGLLEDGERHSKLVNLTGEDCEVQFVPDIAEMAGPEDALEEEDLKQVSVTLRPGTESGKFGLDVLMNAFPEKAGPDLAGIQSLPVEITKRGDDTVADFKMPVGEQVQIVLGGEAGRRLQRGFSPRVSAYFDNAGSIRRTVKQKRRSTRKKTSDNITLKAVEGAVGYRSSETQWVFEPDGPTIPVAIFETPSEEYRLHLPTNPLDGFPANGCSVDFYQSGGKVNGVECRVLPARHAAFALQEWWRNNELLQISKVAAEARQLLLGKYEDPSAALMGALILYRLDRLEDHMDWLENLARDFAWLSDARILLEIMHIRMGGFTDDSLRSILEHAHARMLYTETYSNLIHLLRYGAKETAANEAFERQRRAILGRIAERTVSIDWSAMSLTFRTRRTEQ